MMRISLPRSTNILIWNHAPPFSSLSQIGVLGIPTGFLYNFRNVQYRPTETIHRASSAFRVRARIFRASFERDGLQIALAIAFRVTRLLVRVVSITFRVDAIYYWRCAKLKSKQFLRQL